MRAIVTTIMKDEPAKFIKRWAASCEDADERVLVDTGSSNDAVQVARRLGVTVHEIAVDPWRFDRGRNEAMALLPDWDDGVVITLDTDEILAEGWREKLEAAATEHPEAGQFSYRFIWSWTADGDPDVEFFANRCVRRHGWRWKGPCHEVLQPIGFQGPKAHAGFTIEHHPDTSKSRSSYLGLLELAVKEEPEDPRSAFYYGRELYFVGKWVEARAELVRFLQLPKATWPPERAAGWRLLAKMDYHPERWLLRAVAEDPTRRESWVALADHWMSDGSELAALGAAARALEITERQGDYLTDAASWDDARLRKFVSTGLTHAAVNAVFE